MQIGNDALDIFGIIHGDVGAVPSATGDAYSRRFPSAIGALLTIIADGANLMLAPMDMDSRSWLMTLMR
ncbi:MAG TPA: hypothetical protein VH302_10940 [Bryobacteraceae bacterium]|jgi:hypothetical protein|nr:hypothetical protein [Bryobacteraceae bacterium]